MSSSLLPSHHDAFRTREYWDKFFLERDAEAFEWYGSFRDLSGQIDKHVPVREHSCLVIGCGNSEFSNQLYDSGRWSIRNLDFSEQVISEMKAKNQGLRPTMHWDVGDMTGMTEYADGQFDVVFDKGALDALMSVESEQVVRQAQSMFSEIGRVLATGGKYLCVTLAEPYILRTLVEHFFSSQAGGCWSVAIESVQVDKPSPFLPLLLVVKKGPAISPPHIISLFVNEWGRSMPSPVAVAAPPHWDILDKIAEMQTLHGKAFHLRDIKVGRFETFEVYSSESKDIPRFTITIVDADNSAASTLSCAVLFLPSGREAEYQFATQGGLEGIAGQAGCKRLLAVRCNRPHVFSSNMQSLQHELDSVVLGLRPALHAPDERIPYMAVAKDEMWETVAEGQSALSGKYVVEEREDEDMAAGVFRRLIFLQNQNFVQTELRLVERRGGGSSSSSSSSASSSSSGKKGKGGGGKKGKSSAVGDDGKEFDHTYMDAHHCAVLAGLTLCPSIIRGAMRGSSRSSGEVTGLVVGLGGGAMTMCLQRYLPEMRLHVCDIDPDLEALARAHFAFKRGAKTSVVVGDGMALLEALKSRTAVSGSVSASEVNASVDSSSNGSIHGSSISALPADLGLLDFLFIDVDSKDPSLGMSAPPQAFITRAALQTMHAVLRPGGLLALNLVARTASLRQALLALLRSVFGSEEEAGGGEQRRVFTVRGSEEDVNVTVLAVKSAASEPAPAPKTKPGKAARVGESQVREGLLDEWLRASGLQSDPLELNGLLAKMEAT